MAEFNLLKKTADERRSELYGLAPYLVYKVGERTYNSSGKISSNIFYPEGSGAFKDVPVTEVLSSGAGCTTFSGAFRQATTLKACYSRYWDLSAVNSLANTFSGCTSLEIIDVSLWNTSAITTTQNVFNNCPKINKIDCRKWDTSSLNNSQASFFACTHLEYLGLFGIPSNCVTTNMFNGCTALTDVRCGGLIYPSLSFASSPLTAESVIDILEHLADTPDEGATITFKAGIYAGFTSAEREVIDALVSAAVANGWTIVNMSAA